MAEGYRITPAIDSARRQRSLPETLRGIQIDISGSVASAASRVPLVDEMLRSRIPNYDPNGHPDGTQIERMLKAARERFSSEIQRLVDSGALVRPGDQNATVLANQAIIASFETRLREGLRGVPPGDAARTLQTLIPLAVQNGLNAGLDPSMPRALDTSIPVKHQQRRNTGLRLGG